MQYIKVLLLHRKGNLIFRISISFNFIALKVHKVYIRYQIAEVTFLAAYIPFPKIYCPGQVSGLYPTSLALSQQLSSSCHKNFPDKSGPLSSPATALHYLSFPHISCFSFCSKCNVYMLLYPLMSWTYRQAVSPEAGCESHRQLCSSRMFSIISYPCCDSL